MPPVQPPVSVSPAVTVAPVLAAPATSVTPRTPRTPRTAATPPRAASALSRVSAPLAPLAPPSVITVVHRLSGWKLLTHLTSAQPARVVGVEDLSFSADVHTNIVAGYVSSDGRTIITRLPQAEAEAETVSVPPSFEGFPAGMAGESELVVVRNDGTEVKAKFVGLDASTGLSFLEVAEPLLPPMQALRPLRTPIVEGQRVHLFAPGPVISAPPPPTPAVAPQPSVAPVAPVVSRQTSGDEGFIYAGMGTLEGRLTQIKRAPSGAAIEAGVRSESLSPEWTGAIAVNDAGALVGILTRSDDDGTTRLLPAEVIRSAKARVLARRSSVLRPWLGARGAAVSNAPLDSLLANGWPRAEATALVNKRLGVLLTSVVPGTPAALAGLRTGDVVARIDAREVKNMDDFSFFLGEAGSGSTLSFTILRAAEHDPLRLSVKLSEAQNPASATQRAEARAALEQARREMAGRRAVLAKARLVETEARNEVALARRVESDARAANDGRRVSEAQKLLTEAMRKVSEAEARVAGVSREVEASMKLVTEAERRAVELERARLGAFAGTPLVEGLDAIGISRKLAERFQARGGLLVVSVRTGSAAERLGLRAGDVIETVNDDLIPAPVQASENNAFEFKFESGALKRLGVVRGGQKISFQLPSNSSPK